MTISIDTNIFAALWNPDEPLSSMVATVLRNLYGKEQLFICGTVYAELMAGPLRDELALDMFFMDTGIQVDWNMDEAVIRLAGHSYSEYADRRRRVGAEAPGRILADFLIGAHALRSRYSLLTLDTRHFSTWFPELSLLSVPDQSSLS